MRSSTAARRCDGFTLIELMIVVVIATILISIAVPSYMQQIRQSRRTEAKTALLDAAGREERYFSTSTAYTQTPAQLGYAALPAAIGSGYYTLNVCSPACAPSAVATPSYTVTATPVAGLSQAGDTQCASFSVDSTGAQFAFTSGGVNNTAFCWSN
ncbi:MAG TPA: type IV pilin protein [Steroidobacteraceae bacterium]|jgi:type IV pilus assembly protein PilE|nr:type IV pilin protein [Steroidobacteraceae bacterium]